VSRPDPTAVQSVAVISTGVIGAGWAAHYLGQGYDVVAWDPGDGAEERLRAAVDNAWPTLRRLGLKPGASPQRLTFASTLSDAVADCQFVQESAPESLPLKLDLLAALDDATDPDVVIASSTSGFAMTAMAAGCRHRDRLVVGHPFNPAYLIPLVEICPGKETAHEVVAWADAFYTHAGKTPLVMTNELPGFIGNRLQEAMWREALHMVAAGEATPEQLDAAITEGPGLRWALMGPCLTFHLAGGLGGMAHMLEHFREALLEPWTRLEAPPLTVELVERMVEGTRLQADGRSIAELERQRDEFLADVLHLRRRYSAVPPAATATPLPRPFEVAVDPAWLDYNGHVTDAAYAVIAAAANEALFADVDLSEDYRRRTGKALYTARTTIAYHREIPPGSVVQVLRRLDRVGTSSCTVSTQISVAGELSAETEHAYVHVDADTGASTRFSDAQRSRLEPLLDTSF
jgi:carnitine 3-dehydrogenase